FIETAHDKILQFYPYKPVSVLPEEYCDEDSLQAFTLCRIRASQYWGTEIEDYFTISKEFCCFAYGQLVCELKAVQQCQRSSNDFLKLDNFSRMLDTTTRQTIEPFCDPFNLGEISYSCFFNTGDLIKFGVGLLITGLMVALCFYCGAPVWSLFTTITSGIAMTYGLIRPYPVTVAQQ
ncbi:hypothetical protein DERP_013890, partial [Dermatophagoides pteronyssinus]